MPHRPLFVFLLACTLLALWPRAAQADVRRCVTASGQTIFTDRRCDEVDAVERLPRDQARSAAALHRGGGCARSLQDLVFTMTSAIDARDANQLAGIYHWPGTSTGNAYRIWTQLDAIVNRPLVDIVPVMPGSRPPPEPVTATGDSTTNDGTANASKAPVDGDLYPQTTVRRDPVGLRVEQTIGRSAAPARTVFGLTRYFGCWWVRF